MTSSLLSTFYNIRQYGLTASPRKRTIDGRSLYVQTLSSMPMTL